MRLYWRPTLEARPAILEVEGVHSGYGEIKVLKGVSCLIKAGAITCMIGANGAGKSTLLKTIFGILKPTAGRVVFEGEQIGGKSPKVMISRGIAYVPQGRCNFPQMSVQENLEMGAFTRKENGVGEDIRVLYSRFPLLEKKRDEFAGNLSGGQQQILEMAVALMLKPQLLLIDEPSLGLAPKIVEEVFEVIKEIRDQGRTILMVEQNAKKALTNSDFAFVLELGQNWLQGTGAEILENPEVRTHYLGR